MATKLSDIDLFGGTRPKRPKGRGGAASAAELRYGASQTGGARRSSGGSGSSSSSSPLDPMVKKDIMGAVKSKGALDQILASDAPQSVKDYAKATYEGQRKKKPNTDKSLFHAVTHNPLTDVVGGALNLVPTGLRAIVAGTEELSQKAVGYEDGRSFGDKIRDSHYGVKSVLDAAAERGDPLAQNVQGFAITPSSVLGKNLPQLHADTAFGLVGDVALDPLTYVTAGVSGAAHGAETLSRGEQALQFATKANEAVDAAEKARYTQLAADVLKNKNVGKEALAELGLQRNIRFAGLNTGVGGEAVAKVFQPINRTKQAAWNVVGNTLLEHIGADELKLARKAIHVGEDPVEAVQGMWAKHARNIAKGAAGTLGARRTERLASAVRDAHADGIDGKLVADALDGDAGAIAAIEAAHPEVLGEFRDWTNMAHDQLGLGERKVENYFPRVFNSQVDSSTPAFRKLFQGTHPSPHELTRLTNGDRFGEFILGSDQLVKEFGPVVRHQMEGIWKSMGNDTKLFVDDAFEALPRYSHSINDRIELGIHDRYLAERGVIVDRPTETVPVKGAAKAEKSAARQASRDLRAAEKRVAKVDELQAARDAVEPHRVRVEELRQAQARVDEVALQPHDPKTAKFLQGERRLAARRLSEAERLQARAEAEVVRLEKRAGAAAGPRVSAAALAEHDLQTALAKEQRGLSQDVRDVSFSEASRLREAESFARGTAVDAARSAELVAGNSKYLQNEWPARAAAQAAPTEAEVAAATRVLEDHLGVTEYNKAVRAKKSVEGINYTPLDQVKASTLEKNAAYAEASAVKAQAEVDALTLAVENGGGAATQAELRAAQVNLDTIQGVAVAQRRAADAAAVLERVPAGGDATFLDEIAARLDDAEVNLEQAIADRRGIAEARKELRAVQNELRRSGLPTEGEALATHIDEKLGSSTATSVHMSDKAPFDPLRVPVDRGDYADVSEHLVDRQAQRRRAAAEWAKLGDDDPVVVYHGSEDPRNIAGIRESGKVDLRGVDGHMRGTSDNRGIKEVGALYVTLNPELASGYGDHVVSMVVPKRLIKPSSEVLWGIGDLEIPGVVATKGDLDHYAQLADALGTQDRTFVSLIDGEGAVLPHGTPLADVTVHDPEAFGSTYHGVKGQNEFGHAIATGADPVAALADLVAKHEATAADATMRAEAADGLARHLATKANKLRKTLGEPLVLPEAPKAIQTAATKYDELKPILDQAREAEALVSGDTKAVIGALQKRIDQLDQAIETAKNPTRAKNLKEARAARDAARASLERSLGEDGPSVKFVLGLDAAASEAEAQLRESLAQWTGSLETLVDARNAPKFKEVFSKELGRGMALFPEDESKMWPQWMQDARDQLVPVSQSNKFIEGVDWFNRVFKAQATLSPGFHVRNAYSAVFMNMVHGVSLGEMEAWHKALTAYRKGGIEAVAESERGLAQQIVDAGFLTSGTRWSHELSAMGEGRLTGHVGDFSAVAPQSTWESLKSEAKGNLVTKRDLGDNPVNRVSNFAGVRVEQYARSVLAYHDLKAGMSLETAWERVAHVHFDYTDLSRVESGVLKRLIPFWTWTSRNLPLQIESILTKPKWYSRFLTVKRNVELSAGPMDPLTPRWLQDSPSAIRVGSDQWLTPDLPFAGASDLSRGLRDEGPLTLMQDVAPVFRLPFEAKSRTQSFGDIPLSDKPVPMPTAWLPLVYAIRAATGDSVVFRDPKSKEWQIAGDKAYMMESMFPLLGRARRLAPNDPKYQERAVQSWLGFMGFGTRKVQQRDRESSTFQIADDLKGQLRWLENHGYDTRSAFQRHQDYRKAEQKKARGGG